MKSFLLILMIAFVLACKTKEREPEYNHVIKAGDLVRIVEDGQINELTSFFKMTGFYIRDTNYLGSGNNSFVEYRCIDPSGHSSMRATIRNGRVSTLGLYTENKRLFDKIDEDLKKEGFYHNQDLLSGGELIKRGSPVAVLQFIESGGNEPLRYQIIIQNNKR